MEVSSPLIAARYQAIFDAIGAGTGAFNGLLHVHAGLTLLFLARILTGKSLTSWIPFFIVLCAAAVKEVLDRFHHGAWRLDDTSLDLLNTLWWPFVITMAFRLGTGRPTQEAG